MEKQAMTFGKAERQFEDGVSDELKQKVNDFLDRPYTAEPEVIISYEARNRHADYLLTKEWRRLKRCVLKRDGSLCWRCGGKATIVHHRSYGRDVMAGNNLKQLASVCDGCHTVIHLDNFGDKRAPEEWDRILLEKCHDTYIPVPKVDMRRSRPKLPQE